MRRIPEQFFSARDIAAALGVCKRNIQRRAARERWPKRRVQNKDLFAPPPAILHRVCLVIVSRPAGAAQPRLITRAGLAEALRLLGRVACLFTLGQLRLTLPIKAALRQTTRVSPIPSSTSALRRWSLAYARAGLSGLCERKRGRVGPKKRKH